ncbi:MAG: family 43 glycosylhydrolase [Clostridia bacterium]|nr:family 43 glycosylhydrolase [Clostridia bacterium]
MNPILPRTFHMADAEAHVMPDGRLYIVGSTDTSGSGTYCGTVHHIWSTDDPALEKWIDHGVVFENSERSPGIPWAKGVPLYAPDMIHKNGRYYLYMCGANAFEAVATAEKPEGPYTDACKIEGADGDSIDPAIFVDDDGSAYYLWGQFHLRGAKLKDNMYELDMSTYTDNILTEQLHGFHEGSSLRKIGSRYYIVYTDISRGRATCMSYAVADSPLGPYKKGGVIVDNIYCDPGTWNNHGSIQEYKGRTFVFYHRSSQNSGTSRRVCVEPITVRDDGSIPEVPMTSNGASDPIDAFCEIDASLACRMKGSLYIVPDPQNPGAEKLTSCGGGNWTEAWAEYRTVDLGSGAHRFFVNASGFGSIVLMTEKDGRIGRAEVNTDGAVFSRSGAVLDKVPSGVQTVWLLFDGSGMEVRSFGFE